MSTLLSIIVFGFLMSCIALVGSISILVPNKEQVLPALIAFGAGSLLGGAILHMIPKAVEKMGNTTEVYVWLMAGFTLFLALEQFLNWHHSHTHSHTCSPFSPPHQHTPCPSHSIGHIHAPNGETGTVVDSPAMSENFEIEEARNNDTDTDVIIEVSGSIDVTTHNDITGLEAAVPDQKRAKHPVTYMILLADALHNFIGGLFVGASFIDSFDLGLSAWIAAAAHEVPQELGDFAVLVHGGWSHRQALIFNFLSALTFLIGGIVAYGASKAIDVDFLIPFAAGNFIYIGATDLIPEIKHYHGLLQNSVHFISFVAGVSILLMIRLIKKGW